MYRLKSKCAEGKKALKCLFSVGEGGVDVAGDVDVHCDCRAVQKARLWATGWPGWVSLEGEGALAQRLGRAGVSGSALGLPVNSGPRTPRGFP